MVDLTKISAPLAALALVRLEPLVARPRGSAEIGVGLVDGPVAIDHPDLAEARIRRLGDAARPATDSPASLHATFVAGIPVARRGAPAPAICPGCTLLSRPVFGVDVPPAAAPDDVGRAIVECVDAGGRIVNLSAATNGLTTRPERGLGESLDYASARGALVIAAAGNQATLGSSEITRHRGVIPV